MATREQRRSRGENAAIKEWLAKGNKITYCPPGARSETGEIGYTAWGRKKKKVDPKADPKAKKTTKKG